MMVVIKSQIKTVKASYGSWMTPNLLIKADRCIIRWTEILINPSCWVRF